MNLSKKTLKHLDYLASQVPEYPAACLQSCCDFYEDGCCNGNYDSELWCPYEIFKPELFQDNYRFDIEIRYPANFKEWKRVEDPVYKRCRRYYIRFFKKRKKNEKAAHKKVNR